MRSEILDAARAERDEQPHRWRGTRLSARPPGSRMPDAASLLLPGTRSGKTQLSCGIQQSAVVRHERDLLVRAVEQLHGREVDRIEITSMRPLQNESFYIPVPSARRTESLW
ncbi:hypothetical protein [Salinifilum ghardaiensis]